MKKLTRYLLPCFVLLVLTFGTVSSNTLAPRPQNEDDPACSFNCFVQFQACYFAAFPSRSEGNKCVAAYRHCIAHCN